jgi:16S rRNA (uracil1498-N3)-methyltransferase
MKRFFIQSNEITKPFPEISGQDALHIIKVLRLNKGDHIVLLDGTGLEYEAEIVRFSKNCVYVSIVRKILTGTESSVQIIVGQGYLKDKKMDLLVRHLTEIGIFRWIPVITERSIPQPDKKRMLSRTRRWKTIANEAVKQCKRSTPPEIAAPMTFQEIIRENNKADVKIIFYENETIPIQKTLIPEGQILSKILILLGPEGGFNPKEVDLAKASGFITASLGPRILKVETASISACTLVQYLFGDMG